MHKLTILVQIKLQAVQLTEVLQWNSSEQKSIVVGGKKIVGNILWTLVFKLLLILKLITLLEGRIEFSEKVFENQTNNNTKCQKLRLVHVSSLRWVSLPLLQMPH